MENLMIRKAKYSDLHTMRNLLTELNESMYKSCGIDVNVSIKNFSSCLRNNSSHILLAGLNDEIVGLVNFTVRNTLMHKGASAIIDELIISKNYQNQGIGEDLISATIEECKKNGCCEIEVSTEQSNSAAIDFYKNCGFKEVGLFLEKDL